MSIPPMVVFRIIYLKSGVFCTRIGFLKKGIILDILQITTNTQTIKHNYLPAGSQITQQLRIAYCYQYNERCFLNALGSRWIRKGILHPQRIGDGPITQKQGQIYQSPKGAPLCNKLQGPMFPLTGTTKLTVRNIISNKFNFSGYATYEE